MTTIDRVVAATIAEPGHPVSASASTTRRSDRSAFRPVDGASLGFLRIAFGLMVAWEGIRYLDRGWVDHYYGGDKYTFTYSPFEFVQPLPEPFRPLPWVLMIVAGSWLATGNRHRGAAALCLLTLSYTLLLDKSQYLNHIYLMALLAFLLIMVPAGNALTLGRQPDRPIPALAVELVAFQVAIPYIFGGLAKLNGEWIQGRPLVAWLTESDDVPLLGPVFGQEAVGHSLALASIGFDLTIVGFLLWRRTRAPAFLLVAVFHLLNARLFSIGVFPWLMILATTIFLPVNWPRTLLANLRDAGDRHRRHTALTAALGAAVGAWFFQTVVIAHVLVSAFAFVLVAWLFTNNRVERAMSHGAVEGEAGSGRWTKPILAIAALWVAVQVTVPLRHHLSPTDVVWAEDGHRFSWRMKLRDKSGSLQLTIREPDGQLHDLDLDRYLRPRQLAQMATRPDMVVQFAKNLEVEAGHDIGIFAESSVSLNGRQPERFIRPDIDLTEVETTFLGTAWYVTPRPD